MEVGAVKQAFNNELILLKKNLNQARTQIIHKLTRKAKTLTQKKSLEAIKEKLKRKAESAVNEVLILKKIKVKDLAQFIITHQGELNDYLNRPTVDQNKACARLLLHKSLQQKYKHIRGKFANVPIRDLFMSRQERLKLKKEAKEKQKKKKKGNKDEVINAEGDWIVEDFAADEEDEENPTTKDMSSDEEDRKSEPESTVEEISSEEKQDIEMSDNSGDEHISENEEMGDESEGDDSDNNIIETTHRKVNTLKPTEPQIIKDKNKIKKDKSVTEVKNTKNISKKQEKKKDVNKNKNFNEKIQQRKFKKNEIDAPVTQSKIVDPFFITATGENYMSVVEPRQPDEVKDIHKQGNRKLRRAAMFGHVAKTRPKVNKYDNEHRFNQNNSNTGDFRSKFNDKSDRTTNFNDDNRKGFDKNRHFNRKTEEKPEKLHPSWEAKKKQSGILPFQGKKIVFDET